MQNILKIAAFTTICSLFTITGHTQQVTLKQALNTTLQHNPEIKINRFDAGLAEADIITAGLRPNFTLNNQTLLLVDPPYFAPNVPWTSNRNRQDWWQLTKPVQWPGQRKWRILTARKQSEVVRNEVAEATRDVLYRAAIQWLSVWVKTKTLQVISEAKTNIDSLLIINTYRFEKQFVTETELMRTRILKQQYDILYQNARIELMNEHRLLKLVMGITDTVAVDTSVRLMTVIENLDSLRNRALSNRPDLLTVKSQIDFSATNIRLQRRLAFPQLELGVIWNPQNTIQYVGFFGTVDLPVFNRNQGEIRKAATLKEKYEQSLFFRQQVINTEVTNAYLQFQEQKKNKAAYTDILRMSDQVLASVQYAYHRGATNIIDYLEAQRSWLDVRTEYLQTLSLYYQSYIDLLHVTGNLNSLVNE